MPAGVYPRKPLSEETKRKIGLANSISLKGNKLSIETKEKIRIASLGRKHPPRSDEWRERQRKAKCGKKHKPCSDDTKQKIRKALLKNGHKPPVYKGKDCHFWKGGITPINEKIRKSLKYKIWRNAVFKRDNYTCQNCGMIKCGIEADHIKPFALFAKLRFKIGNGRTLCKKCHRETETFGSKTKITNENNRKEN